MSKIVINHNFKRLGALLKGLGSKKDVQKAVARSIKRTLTTTRKVAAQEIRAKKLLKLSSSQVKQKIHLYDKAKPSTPVESQYGKLWFGSKGESLGRFYAKLVGGKVQVNSYGAPYLREYKSAFLLQRGQGPVVFARVGKARLPIKKLKGPGMAELVEQSGIISRLVTVATTRYEQEFDRNVEFYAQKALERAMAAKLRAK